MAETPFQVPDPMTFDGNVAEEWKMFKQLLEFYLEATGKASKPDKMKIGVMMSCIGRQGVYIYNTFDYDATNGESKDKYDVVVQKFEDYCTPKKNLTYERYVFNVIVQEEGETADAFVTRLNNQAKKCEFGDLEQSMVKDRIVVGCRDSRVQVRMLRDSKLTYATAVETLKSNEIVLGQTQVMRKTVTTPTLTATAQGPVESPVNKVGRKEYDQVKDCMKCGGSHPRKQCPAYLAECHKCGEKGHYAKKCSDLKNNAKCAHCGEKTVHSVDHELQSSKGDEQIDDISSLIIV